MKGIKLLVISASSGFILSFLFGLFSHTSIISVLLKAVLFAVIFGILGFLINLAVNKFLIDDLQNSSDLTNSDSTENEVASGNESKTGQMVDITIQDEELEKGESDNHFVVGNAHSMLKDSDIDKSELSDQTEKNKNQMEAEKQGFVPLTNFENVKNVSEKEAVSPESIPNNSASKMNFNSESIDTLPDIGDLAIESETESDNKSDDDEMENDSDYVPLGNKKSENAAEVKDAALIAKAISSVLSGENSE